MKITHRGNLARAGLRGSVQLPSLLIAATLLLLVIAAALSTHVFGMKMMGIIETNRGVDDRTRQALQYLEAEVQDAANVMVGRMAGSKFLPTEPDVEQTGSALMVIPRNPESVPVLYYVDPKMGSLHRMIQGQTKASLVAEHLADADAFLFEDYSGRVMTNLAASQVLHARLRFAKVGAGRVGAGQGQAFKQYELNSKIALSIW